MHGQQKKRSFFFWNVHIFVFTIANKFCIWKNETFNFVWFYQTFPRCDIFSHKDCIVFESQLKRNVGDGILMLQHLQDCHVPAVFLIQICTGLFEMTVGVLTTCHTQYTWDRSICIFLFNRTTLQVFVTYLVGAIYVQPLWFYRVIRNDCRGFNNLSYTIHLR